MTTTPAFGQGWFSFAEIAINQLCMETYLAL